MPREMGSVRASATSGISKLKTPPLHPGELTGSLGLGSRWTGFDHSKCVEREGFDHDSTPSRDDAIFGRTGVFQLRHKYLTLILCPADVVQTSSESRKRRRAPRDSTYTGCSSRTPDVRTTDHSQYYLPPLYMAGTKYCKVLDILTDEPSRTEIYWFCLPPLGGFRSTPNKANGSIL